jgi:hypothetical protein
MNFYFDTAGCPEDLKGPIHGQTNLYNRQKQTGSIHDMISLRRLCSLLVNVIMKICPKQTVWQLLLLMPRRKRLSTGRGKGVF